MFLLALITALICLTSVPISLLIGWRAGKRHRKIGDSCGSAWGLSILIGTPIFALAWKLVETDDITDSIVGLLLASFLIVGILSSVPASATAFIAYNFGARRRAREALDDANHSPPHNVL